MFTVSPVTEYDLRSPAPIPPATTCPVLTPICSVSGELVRAFKRSLTRRGPLDHVEGGTECALGVVLMRSRRAEQGEQGIADELVDKAAEPCTAAVISSNSSF